MKKKITPHKQKSSINPLFLTFHCSVDYFFFPPTEFFCIVSKKENTCWFSLVNLVQKYLLISMEKLVEHVCKKYQWIVECIHKGSDQQIAYNI